ncbi:MAG: ISL3 family transposase [Gammaproteobacteria bacterium]|nr:ISL3 family transposase [Gammaproteobacteria bacterium]
MSTSFLYHTQGIRNFKYQKTEYQAGQVIIYIRSNDEHPCCPICHSAHVDTTQTVCRDIRAVPSGNKSTLLRVLIRRIRCKDCKAFKQELLPFCSGMYTRYTRALARYVVSLRAHMSISAVAQLTGLHWETVKNIEKEMLKKKFKRIPLKDVKILGIDEVYMGKQMGFLTIVRDMLSGHVLYVAKGKGVEALSKFNPRIRKRAKYIQAVCIDMSHAYSAWSKMMLPHADIVYDHFHVIKLMNEKLDSLRRQTMNQLDEEQKRELKSKRLLLLRNEESLDENALDNLKKIRFLFRDLGTASLLKECLRRIYILADCSYHAKLAFLLWCDKAEASGISCLEKMAKAIKQRLPGLLAYWKHNKITSASQEGFNNKIGWLTRQAYGYRDEEYLHLKIFDLPNLSTVKVL